MELPDQTKPLYLFVVSGIENDIEDKTADQEQRGTEVSAAHTTSAADPNSGKPMPRGQKELLFNKLIGDCHALRKFRMDYATDGIRFIVAWRDLRPDFKEEAHDNPEHTADSPSDVVFQKRIDFHDGRKMKSKTLKVHYRDIIPISSLIEPSNGTQSYLTVKSEDTSFEIAPDHVINLILAKAAKGSSASIFRVGRNKFYLEDQMDSLCDGIVSYRGFFSTVKVGMGKPLLNVSLATSAFWKPGPLTGFPEAYAIGRKVRVCYGTERIKTIHSFGKMPSRQMFKKMESGTEIQISVLNYLRGKPEIPEWLLPIIAVSTRRCVNTAQKGRRPEWFPQELLEIAKYQPCGARRLPGEATASMIAIARTSPFEGLQRIVKDGLRLLGAGPSAPARSILDAASIVIHPKVLQVPARQIAGPTIRYASGNAAFGRNNKWNLERKKFFNTTNRLGHKFLVLFPQISKHEKIDENTARVYGKGLATEMTNTGIQYNGHSDPDNWFELKAIDFSTSSGPEEAFKASLKDVSDKTLVVFVNPNSSSTYSTYFDNFKRVAEQEYGLQTLCITHATLRKQNDRTQYFANAAMKVNLKLRNYNHAIATVDRQLNISKVADVNLNDTIVLGADVTHTQQESDPGSFSLVALVGSIDGTLGQFYGSMTYLDRNSEAIAPDNMMSMTQQRLKAFYKKTGRLPSNVLFYRDGVDEGQYARVQTEEVLGIKNGYSAFAKSIGQPRDPKITTVIVTKRHNTRFYPKNVFHDDENARRTNCSPGTCVDSGVTHPNYFEFYLQSHHPIQGTARPARYFVLENGMNLTEVQLQRFTYELCYSYVRATLPVGYAPPAYYADRLCERARCYFADFLKPQETPDDSSVGGKAMSEAAGYAGDVGTRSDLNPAVGFDDCIRAIRDMFPEASENYVREMVEDKTRNGRVTIRAYERIVDRILHRGKTGPEHDRAGDEEKLEVTTLTPSSFTGPNRGDLYNLHLETVQRLFGMTPGSASSSNTPDVQAVASSFKPIGKWKDRWDIPRNENGPWHPNLNDSMFWM